jgi:ABC-type nitrate/sulfonate/bicarbonate transport system substrate-binding protein
MQWLTQNKDRVAYVVVTDETTGQKFDTSLGWFVESEIVTVPQVKNRIHAFARKDDAIVHAKQFNGALIENPFGAAFQLPAAARFPTLAVAAPRLPDALPLRLAVFKPIFKENRLNVSIVEVKGEADAEAALSNGSAEALFCDLPTALVLAHRNPEVKIIKNALRANPFRPLFALVAGQHSPVRDAADLGGQRVALPKGISFRLYLDLFLAAAGVPASAVNVLEVDDSAAAWAALTRAEVSAALLRTPYTDAAIKRGMTLLADDRNLPWTSVLVVKTSVLEEKPDAVKKFVFGLEQAVLALNLKPDEYRGLVASEAGLPPKMARDFPTPIFEGANAPSREEIEPILSRLKERQALGRPKSADDLVDTRFLPDPAGVGLAFCCR